MGQILIGVDFVFILDHLYLKNHQVGLQLFLLNIYGQPSTKTSVLQGQLKFNVFNLPPCFQRGGYLGVLKN